MLSKCRIEDADFYLKGQNQQKKVQMEYTPMEKFDIK